jgi:actin-related protein 8
MASILRRAWSSVQRQNSLKENAKSTAEASSSGSERNDETASEVMSLPSEILFSIFARLNSVDLAAANAVCRSWHAIADDDLLWHARLRADNGPLWPSVQFAETFLRAGFSQRPASDVPTKRRSQLPGTALFNLNPDGLQRFRSIYSQRAGVPRAIILDGGSGYAKFGWSNEVAPQFHLATFLEFGNVELPLYQRSKDLFTTVFNRMRVKPSAQPIVLSTPTVHSDDSQIEKHARRQLRETTFAVLFELGVPAICAIDQAVLALLAANLTSGIVVNIGFHVTTVAPGKKLYKLLFITFSYNDLERLSVQIHM